MNAKHAIIVDSQGYKKEFVLVETETVDGKTVEKPYGYTMQQDEQLVYDDISMALSMIQPCWNGEKWVETGTPPPPDMEAIKQQAILQTKLWVAAELEKTIPFNGKNYSVTMEKQNLLSAQLGLYGLNAQVGIPYQLTWNATGEECEVWAFEDLLMLSNTIAAHVAPIVKKQQTAEINIKLCGTPEQANIILEDFSG